jgi:hypothetical protein
MALFRVRGAVDRRFFVQLLGVAFLLVLIAAALIELRDARSAELDAAPDPAIATERAGAQAAPSKPLQLMAGGPWRIVRAMQTLVADSCPSW